MREFASLSFTAAICSYCAVVVQASDYPEATLDQATVETKHRLKIERLAGMSDHALDAEYGWAADMAALCFANHATLCKSDVRLCDIAIEFQRHAGRIARYRGRGEQAVEDYFTAVRYAEGTSASAEEGQTRTQTILRDIADAYLHIGAYEVSRETTQLVIAFLEARGEDPTTDLERLAEIASLESRFADAVEIGGQVVQNQSGWVVRYLARHPSLKQHSDRASWEQLLQNANVLQSLREADKLDLEITTPIHAAHSNFARALRLNGQLDRAERILECAALTPWQSEGSYRTNHDFELDREWAALWFAQGKTKEALGRAERCLQKYSASMHAYERVELLDLVSRAMEQRGHLKGALEKLEEAIGIVEEKRANLVSDEFKQSFVAGYAPLYRRALELTVRLEGEVEVDDSTAEQRPAGAQAATGRAFEWSERVKGRAMLDTLGRYGVRMARALTHGDTDEVLAVRDQAARVIGIGDLQHAPWWPADTVLIEFAYGDPPLSRGGGVETDPPPSQGGERGRVDSGTNPHLTSPLKKGEGLRTPVYVWVVTPRTASFRRMESSAEELDSLSIALAAALQPTREHDEAEAWVEPAARLYQGTIAPLADELKGTRRLIIVADGHLRAIPFEVLISERDAYVAANAAAGRADQPPTTAERRYIPHRLLIEDYAISYAPSATVLDAISRKQKPEAWSEALWAFASTQFGKFRPANNPEGRADLASSASPDVLDRSSEGATVNSQGRQPLINEPSHGAAPEGRQKEAADVETRSRTHTHADLGMPPALRTYRDILRAARSLELDDLKDTGREVTEVARCFKDLPVSSFIDESNMKDMLLSASHEGKLKSVRFLHFATHAFMDPARPYLAGLMLCPPYPTLENAASARATAVSAVIDAPREPDAAHCSQSSGTQPKPVREFRRGHDVMPGLLTLGEIGRLELTSELVVLSACKSLGDRIVDGDWLNGLARSFLVAGASGVLCTLWDAGDRNSALAMPAIYSHMLGGGLPEAVDVPLALQKYKAERLGSRRYGHPALWSPFVYHGRVGASKGT